MKQQYTQPSLHVFGRVEQITGTFDTCIDVDGDGVGKKVALDLDWRAVGDHFSIPVMGTRCEYSV